MTLVRWNPWQEMSSLQRRLNSLFDDELVPTTWKEFGNFSRIPAVEISEADEMIHLKLELPGMEPKDLNVEVTEDAVYISGERKSESKTEEEGVTRSEFHYGKFQRVIPLPTRVENNKVTAEYKDGILNLTLPKSEEGKHKVVKVNLLPEETA